MSALAPLLTPASAWMPASPCTPGLCLDPGERTAGPLRRAARLGGALVILLAGLPLALVLGRTAWRAAVTARWSRLLLRALGVRIEVRRGFSYLGGSARARAVPEEEGPVLLVGNHVSWIDPLVITAIAPCRPLAKAEVGRWPVVRTLAAGGGAIFIDRDRLSALPGVVADMTATLRRGESVAAFPEGTTWCGRDMGRFRPAVFQAALDAGVPVRPFALRFLRSGTRSSGPSYVGDDTLLASVLRIVSIKGLVAEVTVFPGVRPAVGEPWCGPHRLEARRALARIAEAQVRSGLLDHGGTEHVAGGHGDGHGGGHGDEHGGRHGGGHGDEHRDGLGVGPGGGHGGAHHAGTHGRGRDGRGALAA